MKYKILLLYALVVTFILIGAAIIHFFPAKQREEKPWREIHNTILVVLDSNGNILDRRIKYGDHRVKDEFYEVRSINGNYFIPVHLQREYYKDGSMIREYIKTAEPNPQLNLEYQ